MEDYLEIENWLKMMQEELSMILRELGYDSIDALSRQNLRALDFETASVSGLRLSGYERPFAALVCKVGVNIPTISVEQNLIAQLLGKHGIDHDYDELMQKLPLLGTDIDRCDEAILDIEIFPNRPDLLSGETLTRAIRNFYSLATGISKSIGFSRKNRT